MLIKSFLAFGAGFISFLSPCVLPLIPGYISYISGESLGDIVEKQKKVILKTVLFSLGFSLVFISFGATASSIFYWKYIIRKLKYSKNNCRNYNNNFFSSTNWYFKP